MEYIQTILFQIPASRLDEASAADGLLSELDAHRDFLRTQIGFRDLRITRSINTEGNILVVVETRWSDDGSLVRYETSEPNAASIVRRHRGTIVGDSLQVLDMEALRTEASWKPAEQATHARERVVLPVVIPLGVLALALLIIYGLSRVYLQIKGDNATALAAGIAIGVLIVSFYLANNPRAPGWQIGAIVGIAAIVLAGGAIWAVSEKDNNETSAEQPTASAAPSGSAAPGTAAAQVIDMQDFKFVYNGQDDPTINVKANTDISFDVTNTGQAIHNIHVDGADGNYKENFCKPGDGVATACTDPDKLAAGKDGKLTFNLPAGTYKFRCDFHPTQMTGEFVAQ